jgi:hypothetical protein
LLQRLGVIGIVLILIYSLYRKKKSITRGAITARTSSTPKYSAFLKSNRVNFEQVHIRKYQHLKY